MSQQCAQCHEELVEGAGFCEACGAATSGDPLGAEGATNAQTPTSTTDPSASPSPPGSTFPAPTSPSTDVDPQPTPEGNTASSCPHCGGTIGADNYCGGCGMRALEPITVDDRQRIAYATHRGVRHNRNEDSGALALTAEGWPILVVSDGVSASPNPHLASATAVHAATARLGGQPFNGGDDIAEAVSLAHAAACAIPNDTDPAWPADGSHPACTIVVSVSTDTTVYFGNVGDARGYVLHWGDDRKWQSEQLTTDDSVAAQAVSQGMDMSKALSLPGGHAITAWLGADANDPSVHLSEASTNPNDVVMVCSDGLWNYAASAENMDQLLNETLPPTSGPQWPTGALGSLCETLVQWSIGQGGADNITVALSPNSQEEPS